MAIDTNFNVNPYYDDFDEDKKFLRMLFKPGYAVQARELTQAQTIINKQIERFGNHIFKNGSVVTGGQTTLQSATYLKLDSDYAGSTVTANNFVGSTIVDSISVPTKRAEVIKVYDADAGTGDPKTLLIKQIYGDAFVAGDTILTYESSPTAANISSSGVGTGQIFSVNEGVFYYDGFFVKNDVQTIATSKYSNTTANAKIGFEITESTVASSSDTSLLDPAQDASNYQAPGADRFKIELTLSTRSLTSTDTTQFIELARVENGVLTRDYKYPIYSVLEETLARRTFDESGNYTVKPFKISLATNTSNTAQTNITLSPGKAYVFGYEYQTIAPTTITIDKPRETELTQNKRVSADYGYFVYTNNHFGSFPINSLETVDLHCVSNATINVDTTAAITNTKIGTARIKTLAFDSSSNTSDSSTYEYKTFLFDVDIGSITGNVNVATTTTVTIANTGAGEIFCDTDDAYNGAKLRIITGPGSNEEPKTITNFDQATQTITISSSTPFVTTPNNTSIFSIDFEVSDVESIASHSGTSCINSADIDERSKDSATTYSDTYITDGEFEPLLFELGEEYITSNTITDFSFSYRRLYQSQAFTSNVSPALSVGSGETIASATTSSAINQNYQVVVTNAGTSSYSVGEIISVDKITNVDTGTRKLTVTDSQNMTANILATINFTLASGSPAKTKTAVTANSTVQTSGGESINSNGVIVYASEGQTTIEANNVIKTPDDEQSIYVSDVYELVSVYDFNGSAVANTGYTDVTTRYTLDNGQRDSFYDHASIRLKPGFAAPNGPLVVRYNKYSSSGAGFFTVDSYPNYDTIPEYTSPTSGENYKLRDVLDFRPVRSDATAAIGTSVVFDVDASTTGPKIVEYGSDIILDYSYYLPRIDKVVLNKNREFEIVQGKSALRSVRPKDKENGMTLYVLDNPAYVANTSDIDVQYVNNRRYTMRDIGTLDKRIENLEYYTSLSLLEQDAVNKQDLTILDSQNLPRFKNGIIVDGFKGSSVADVFRSEYRAAIDTQNEELRPAFNVSAYGLTFDSANSSSFIKSGPFVTVNSSTTEFIDQNQASRTINVNPFNVIDYLGKIQLNPPSDTWVDTDTRPDVLVNLGGDADAWAFVFSELNPFDLEWGNWQNRWTGTTTGTNTQWQGRALVRQTIQTTNTGQTRQGVLSTVAPETITQSIGDRVIDVSVVPYMRQRSVLFVAEAFKPDTVLYPFFDNTSVQTYVARANKIKLTSNNLAYNTQIDNVETVNIVNTATSTTNATAAVVATSNDSIFIVNVNPTTAIGSIASANVTGTKTGTTAVISEYHHYSGTAASATANTIVLQLDASGATNEALYANTSNSNIIFIVSGTGAGQQATMSSYNAGTRTVTISGTWTTTPDNTSGYSIGRLTTTRAGDVAGVFTIPSGTFRVGEKLFRMTDASTGDLPSSTTSGDASFFAEGLLQTVEETIVSTIAPTIQRQSVTDSRVVSSSRVVASQIIGWNDPLAQTFLVSPENFSQGIFLDKLRFCFNSKDTDVPITLQIRPTVNGYPSSSTVYPYGTVTLTPDKVKTTSSPDLDDATKYTEFVFDAPIYLQPGEHSFILLANSNKYEVYMAEIGQLDLVNNLQISEQPYGGTLFASQNGSTWTADQNSDLMFRIYRKTFSTTPAIAQFLVDSSTLSSNVNYDLTHLITSEINIANTSVAYNFNSEKTTGGLAGLKSIIPLTDYEMVDGSGRRVLNSTTGNTTFILRATIATLNTDISPVLDTTRFGALFVDNDINNLPLIDEDFVITSGGTGYANSADVTVTITGGGGSGATATANVVSNVITDIVLTNGGSGYTTSPTITITPGSGGGSGASISYNGEDKKSGGNSKVRYMTRRVTLADGFDSGDLRVYLTTYRPSGSNIYVYYKVLSASDPDVFNDKNYKLMTQLDNTNFVSTGRTDYRELTFAPGADNIETNAISYTSGSTAYNSFKTFAIKIVMASSETTDVPRVRDLRAIALPSGA